MTELSKDEVKSLIKQTVEETLKKLGKISDTVQLSEIRRLYGQTIANDARASALIPWMQKGKGGRTSHFYCMVEDFNNFLQGQKINS